jgi:hypothetical protein
VGFGLLKLHQTGFLVCFCFFAKPPALLALPLEPHPQP